MFREFEKITIRWITLSNFRAIGPRTLYRVYQKKGNRTLTSRSALNILSTELIISPFERLVFQLLNVAIFIKFDKKLSKCGSNENCQSKSNFSTFGNSLNLLKMYTILGIQINKIELGWLKL